MKRVLLLIVIALSLLFVAGCYKDVGPGEAAIRVNKLGDKRGVEPDPIMTGRASYNDWTQEIIIYPITEKSWAYSKAGNDGSTDDQSFWANSVDAMSFNFDAQITFSIVAEKLPKFYTRYAVNLPAFINGFLRNSTRDAFSEEFSKLTAEQVMGSSIPAIGVNVKNTLNAMYEPYGVKFISVSIINSPRPKDPDLSKAIAAKIIASQKVLEATKKVEEAEQLRQANQKTAEALTPLLIQKMWIEKINPNVQVIYIPSGTNLLTGLPK